MKEMKTRILTTSLIAALALSVTSCNMDLRPYGTIEPDNALQTIDDAQRLRNGLYVFMRSYSGGVFANRDEIRSDEFHALASFGNNGGNVYNWIVTSADGDPQSIWGGSYQVIANANFFIEKARAVNTEEWSAEDKANLQLWMGEAFFFRAYYHLELAENFCLDYVGNEQSLGIPYMTVYNPTSDQSQYPSRPTLEETFANIMSDIDSAAKYVTTPGAVGSMWVTADAVTALRARAALESGDYQTAFSAASSLLPTYPLVAADTAEFRKMWHEDSGKECILQLTGSYPNEVPTSFDFSYLGYTHGQGFRPSYVPEQWVLELYTNLNPQDMRYTVLMRQDSANVSGTDYMMYMFNKFPGNPALRQSISSMNYAHKPKIFRIGEMYLICAEAAQRGGLGDPWTYINQLRESRIPGYTGGGSGDALTEILNERVRELIGEGFRIQDLKRFHVDLQRRAAQNPETIYLPETNQDFFRSYTHYQMTWPIPQAEIYANPHIQQNPGYAE